MSTLIDNATIKIRRDTAGNWSSNNPTPLQGEWCLETDTGNVKIGDGSTAWNALGYYIPAKLAIPYDLTSANKTHTLPPITGAPQTESVYWTGGGTYKLTLAVTDGATVGGETAGTWEGEGNGHILVESDGSNWQVREYEDSKEFIAYLSTPTTVAANSIIIFNSTIKNLGNMYNTTTGKFTAPIPGKYIFSTVILSQAGTDDSIDIRWYKNGVSTSMAALGSTVSTGGVERAWISDTVTLYLNKGDTISVRTYSSSKDFHGSGAPSLHTRFSGNLL